MTNSCIRTGACVLVMPYSGWLVCDLFAVGNVILTNEGTDRLGYGDAPRPLTHRVDLDGFGNHTHPTKHIVAPRAAWTFLEVAEASVEELEQVGGGANSDHPNCYSGHAGGQKIDN